MIENLSVKQLFVSSCAAALAIACGGPAANLNTSGEGLNARGVRDRASFDFACPKEQIQLQDLDGRDLSFGAHGCGKRAAYVWKGSTVILNSPISTDEAAEPPR